MFDEVVLNEKNTHKGSYLTFKGSPASKGILQFDMWGLFLVVDIIGIN